MRRTFDNIIIFTAQGAYSGRFPTAPGTAGTVVGVLLYVLIQGLGPVAYGAFCTGVVVIGTWAAGRADALLGTKDNPTIVIDEIAGYLVSLAFLPFSWWTVVAGFVLFRFFDIVKPWPLHGLQRLSGGVGVMVDDVGAGIYTNLVLQISILVLAR